MSISSVKTGAVGVSLLAGNTYYDPAATFLIERVTSTSGATSITFSSIPQTYKHLQIRFLAKSSAGTTGTYAIQGRFNSDSGTNYATHNINADGATVAATGSASSTDFICGRFTRASETAYGVGVIDIHDYASTTKNKTVRSFSGCDMNGTGYMYLASGLWMNTNAVTSFTLISNGFNSSSTFALYGMV
jgi:hypothetical protein